MIFVVGLVRPWRIGFLLHPDVSFEVYLSFGRVNPFS